MLEVLEQHMGSSSWGRMLAWLCWCSLVFRASSRLGDEGINAMPCVVITPDEELKAIACL